MIDEYKSMGQYYQSSYGNTTLHTNYHYFRFNAFLKNAKDAMKELNSLSGGIEALEAKELAFYKKFGCNSYEEFMNFLRMMMNSDDGKLFRLLLLLKLIIIFLGGFNYEKVCMFSMWLCTRRGFCSCTVPCM